MIMRKGTLIKAFSGKYEILKYSCSPGFQKYAVENRFEKSWFYHRVMIVSVTPSRQEFLLALWKFSCHCCWCLISVLLRTFFFFFFFFDRTLAANASLCRCTGAFSPLKPELKKNSCGWRMTDAPRKMTVTTRNSLASWTDKDCQAPCACAITFSPHRRCPLWKKFGRNPVR